MLLLPSKEKGTYEEYQHFVVCQNHVTCGEMYILNIMLCSLVKSTLTMFIIKQRLMTRCIADDCVP